MVKFLQLLVFGLSLGSLYGLVALGFVVIFKSTGIINFAHGAMVLIAGYLLYMAGAGGLNAPFALAFLLALAAIAVFSVGIERIVLGHASGSSADTKLMITLGLYIVLVTIAEAMFGVTQVSIGVPLNGQLVVSGVHIDYIRIAAIVGSFVCVAALAAFFNRTRLGLSMRIVATDPEVATVLGINVQWVHAVAWAIAGLLGLVAVTFLGSLPGYGLQPATAHVAFRAFPAAVLGGMTSLPGAVVGGLLIGVVEVMMAGYQPSLLPGLGSGFYIVSGYIVMIIILLFRPQGIFGKTGGHRV
ncbi:branched-chain amino acid transport system permease protein [Rhodoligotrophos appendicifer]|uniref:branched-chain amino acid ABC transporter permease n=1 Tax=Rhodoligotrophos appendicifer TaxID=987056 RepID=UPI001186A44A|nr:branched-chain amino acid ABC transporter permease [Rhodoligotrophos appendicifer]